MTLKYVKRAGMFCVTHDLGATKVKNITKRMQEVKWFSTESEAREYQSNL